MRCLMNASMSVSGLTADVGAARGSARADLPSIAPGFCHQRPHQDTDYREVGHQDS
jgi:hypothetical protein